MVLFVVIPHYTNPCKKDAQPPNHGVMPPDTNMPQGMTASTVLDPAETSSGVRESPTKPAICAQSPCTGFREKEVGTIRYLGQQPPKRVWTRRQIRYMILGLFIGAVFQLIVLVFCIKWCSKRPARIQSYSRSQMSEVPKSKRPIVHVGTRMPHAPRTHQPYGFSGLMHFDGTCDFEALADLKSPVAAHRGSREHDWSLSDGEKSG
jgi:hypothetical protein